jgi:hypothetical protein
VNGWTVVTSDATFAGGGVGLLMGYAKKSGKAGVTAADNFAAQAN